MFYVPSTYIRLWLVCYGTGPEKLRAAGQSVILQKKKNLVCCAISLHTDVRLKTFSNGQTNPTALSKNWAKFSGWPGWNGSRVDRSMSRRVSARVLEWGEERRVRVGKLMTEYYAKILYYNSLLKTLGVSMWILEILLAHIQASKLLALGIR